MKNTKYGFSLLEMIVVVAIISLVAGLLIPVAAVVINNKLRTGTIENMQAIEAAVIEFHKDTKRFPQDTSGTAQLRFLSEQPTTGQAPDEIVNNWNGPYLLPDFEDNNVNSNSVTNDEFGTAYEATINTTTSAAGNIVQSELSLRSFGQNGQSDSGNNDDIDKVISIIPKLKEVTREEIDTVNHAIRLHENVSGQPFSATMIANALSDADDIVSFLQGQDLLPDGAAVTLELSVDEFGDDYTILNNGRFQSGNL